ncbi:Calx-beta domain-containing protein, partial [Aliarcobacter cibarius]|uniref:Calx-beta domain-containing protein n=2 Tax=Aliarcobacter cibarius TaxID=255507 RepID=UPI00126C2434
MKLTIREANGSSKVVELAKDLEIVAKKGQQFIFSNGFSSYSMNFKDDQKSVEFLFKIDGKSIKVSLNGIVPFLNENQADIENPTLVLINKDLNDQDIKSIIENNAFNGSEIIDKLESLIASKTNNTALVTDFQSLVETLEAAAAGGEGQGTARTSGVKVGSSDALSDSLFGLQETDKWINLERGISSLPVETGGIVAPVEVENIPVAEITPKDPKDPTPEVPVDPTDPTKPLDPKDPSLGTKGAVAFEGEDLVFTVKVTDSVNPQTYDFVINNGTAEAGKDFTTKNVSFTNGVTYDPTTGKITVPAGVTEFEVVVKTIDDKIIEDTESLTVKVGTSTAVGYIIDNDEEDITVDPDPDPKDPTDPKDLDSKGATVTEGDTAEFKVSLTESSKDQTVTVTLTGATAEKGKDFLNPNETQDIVIKYADGSKVTVSPNADGTYSVKVPAGETNFVVEVKTFDDVTIEDTEEDYTLTVKVGNVEKTVTGKILDNDEEDITVDPDPDPKDPTDPKDLDSKGATVTEGDTAEFKV